MPSALLYAGAVGVVAGLWAVEDNATRLFMEEFYRALTEGKDAAAAIQAAQISLLKTSDFAAPYLWSPFVLTGDSRRLLDTPSRS